MTKDYISIVIPAYNGEKFIRECLHSISVQTVPHEIIVIDDISTDKTVDIAKEMGARTIVNTVHKGQVAGKNTGILNMRGDYFMTIDQDDRLKPDALEMLLKELKKSNSQIVMSRLEDFPESDEDKAFCHEEPFYGILTGAALFRKEVFDMIGLFDESVTTGDVIDLMFRCQKHGVNVYKSDIITCERRIHSSNYGRTNQQDEYRDYAKLLRKQILNNR